MNSYGSTPLHFATTERMVNDLLCLGADVNALNCSGDTPLHSAVIMGRELPVIKSLISAGANVNAVEQFSQFTALHYANSHEIVKELISHGADVNFLSYHGGTPLHVSVRSNKDISIIKLLLSAGADPNAFIVDSSIAAEVETPLISAVSTLRNQDVINLLLSAGSKVTGCAVLHRCLCPETASLLILHGADVNELDELENTPLHAILRLAPPGQNVLDIVRLLIKSGANMNVRNSVGRRPIDYAQERNNLEVLIEFLKHGLKISFDVHLHHLGDTFEVTKCYIKMLILTHYDSYKNIIVYNRQLCNATPVCHCIKWIQFMEDCDREVVRLKKYRISWNFSLFTLVTKKPVKPLSISKEILTSEILATFPLYHEILEEALEKSAERASLRDKFLRMELSSQRKSKESGDHVVLNFDCMNKIANYLGDEDIFIFITAMS